MGNRAGSALVMAMAGPALAGEVQGLHGVVQNWGHTKDAPIILDSRGASYVEFDGTFFELGEGTMIVEGCNPHVGSGDSHSHHPVADVRPQPVEESPRDHPPLKAISGILLRSGEDGSAGSLPGTTPVEGRTHHPMTLTPGTLDLVERSMSSTEPPASAGDRAVRPRTSDPRRHNSRA